MQQENNKKNTIFLIDLSTCMGDDHSKLGKTPAIQMKSSNGCSNYKFSTLNFMKHPYSN